MKCKTVTQYKCDYCGKKKYSKSAMIKHEKHCTMNPQRECRFCIKSQGDSCNNISELVARIPKDIIVQCMDNEFQFEELSNVKEIEAEFNKIKEEINGCPACLLAVIRQSKTSAYLNFDYKKEVEMFWKDYEVENRQSYYDY